MKNNITNPAHSIFRTAPDTARGGPSHRVAEIVRFRLIDGADNDAFLEATRAMQPAVEAAPGYVSRSLSQGEAGVWTDYVVWRDMAAALSAAEEVFKEPVAQTFGAMIEPDSIEMRHEPVLWHTE